MTILKRTAPRVAAVAAISVAMLIYAATARAQSPTASTPITPRFDQVPLTPKDNLSLREIKELQLSPDGKKVLFVVREPHDPKLPRSPRTTNIWIVPTDGSEPSRPLIPNLKNATTPRWSPDGRRVAFLSDAGESGSTDPGATIQIYLIGSGGGKAERLTSVPGGVENFAYSPDGKMIAFIARDQPTAKEQERESAGDDAIEVDRDFKYSRLWVTSLADRKAVQINNQDFETAD